MRHSHITLLIVTSLLLAMSGSRVPAAPLGTAFTYQGRLNDGTNPANGTYDFCFTIHDLASGGTPLAGPLTNSSVVVSDGRFTTTLDFEGGVFTGEARWLEIGVKPHGAAAFTPLSPRQPLTPTPHALYAHSAASAASFTGPLAGEVTGAQGATVVARVAGQSAAQVASGVSAALAATSVNTPDAIVKRDAAGGFSAGVVTVTSVAGDGAGLTGLNASALASGTLDDARLSAKVALRNAHQTFSGSNMFSGVAVVTNTANQFAGTFSGDGGGLTKLNPAHLIPGTAAINITGAAAAVPWSGLSSVPAGFADGVDNDTLYSAGLGLSLDGTRFSASFAGSGEAHTAARSDHHHADIYALSSHLHSGSDLASGTVADARLSTNIARLDQTQTFAGSNRFSGVVVATNAANQWAGTFTGNGAGLTALSPASLASGTAAINISGSAATAGTATTAASAPWSGLSGVPAGLADGVDNDTLYSAGLGLTLTGNTFGLNTNYTDSRYWKLGGNAGTTPGSHFLGTTDNQPLELKVNGTRALRLEYASNVFGILPNVMGGAPANAVASGVVAATIGGGGDSGQGHRITGDFSTIAGGRRHLIEGFGGAIGGGQSITISSNSAYSAVAGGWAITVDPGASYAAIGGGSHHWVQTNASYAAVGGGYNHRVGTNTTAATVAGGSENAIETGTGYATIGGGQNNRIGSNSWNAVISGGAGNQITRENATIAGGVNNRASEQSATVGGGDQNVASVVSHKRLELFSFIFAHSRLSATGLDLLQRLFAAT